MQDAFLRLWERWDQIDKIQDLTGYLFRVALNGFRMRRRRTAMALRRALPAGDVRDVFADAEIRADVRGLLLGLTPDGGFRVVLIDQAGTSLDQRFLVTGDICREAELFDEEHRPALGVVRQYDGAVPPVIGLPDLSFPAAVPSAIVEYRFL